MIDQIIRGPLLIPLADGGVAYHPDGALAFDKNGILQFAGDSAKLERQLSAKPLSRKCDGVILPPLLDLHTHIPQHPIRGRFCEGVEDGLPGGKLLNALKRNVFPAEIKCNQAEYARKVVEDFAADVLANGVVGGAAYATVSAGATETALEVLPSTWSVGLVMMNQNCPEDLRTDEKNLETDISRLAEKFGTRFIVTDRFAVSTTSPLRREGARWANILGLRTQTHLNEQKAEKEFVEKQLYPHAKSYTDVYLADGLLAPPCILAHCIHMRGDEWKILEDCHAAIAHCPTSNLLLGSGLMSLDCVLAHNIPYAIATDVGASPTVSMLAEMGRFLQVHAGKSARATPSEALWRATLAPAQIIGLDQNLGRLEPGRPASFIEAETVAPVAGQSADDVIRALIPRDLDNPKPSILRVTLGGKMAFERGGHHA
jgi:guanine deaminase